MALSVTNYRLNSEEFQNDSTEILNCTTCHQILDLKDAQCDVYINVLQTCEYPMVGLSPHSNYLTCIYI